MLTATNARVYVLRWWWWFRPRACILVPAFLLLLIAVQTIAAYVHYATTPHDDSPPPLTSEPAAASAFAASSALSPVNAFDPQRGVAFAIAVGGRTERSKQLDGILSVLLDGGALPGNIFVFEDVLSRVGGVGSAAVAAVAAARSVSVVGSRVERARPEDGGNFGIGLARHYHFFLDFLLADESTPNVLQRDAGGGFEFAVVIEDDLQLAPDLVKFFLSMSRVMMADDSLYCAAAHQDNAFLGIHRDDEFDSAVHRQSSLSSAQFDFRRGNHFMAPGWMTSRRVYLQLVRPRWLDAQLEYSHKAELHLRNGHWDRFFDSLIGERDCIFPELPRITHQGADGFTVSARGQMELYSNLRLSQLPPAVNYGDLSRLTRAGYIAETERFLHKAKRLHVLEEVRRFRHESLVYVVPAADDRDDEWNAPFNHFFGLIGVGGYGGHVGYVKVRGIFRGAVFVRFLTNLILLVGSYSPYMQQVSRLPERDDGLEVAAVGCFTDSWDRDLPYQVHHYTAASITPRRCLLSCHLLGFRYAGLQRDECWCGNEAGRRGKADEAQCSHQCAAVRRGLLIHLLSSAEQQRRQEAQQPSACGGGFLNSVYENVHRESAGAHLSIGQPPAGVSYLKGQQGESCDAVCSLRGGQHGRCDERFFPLIHRSCAALQSILGQDECRQCVDEEDPERGFATPAYDSVGQRCLLSRGRYHRCNWQPPPGLIRACTCVQ